MSGRPRYRRVLATLGLLILVGCSAGPDASDAPAEDGAKQASHPGAGAGASGSPPSPSPSSPVTAASRGPGTRTPSTVLGPGAPQERACYVLDFDDATQPTTDREPVPCVRRHTAQTIHVGRLDTVVDGHLLAVDSALAQERVAAACDRQARRHTGGDAGDRALSRLRVVWFSPTLAEAYEGATWFRCDLVLVGGPQELAPLPPPRRLAGILDRRGASDEVGLCGTTEPGSAAFERVVCSRRHAWRALRTTALPGGDRYPGAAAVRDAGENTCRNRVRRVSNNPERFRYGWEWPTRAQWRDGQRFGFCWAPD